MGTNGGPDYVSWAASHRVACHALRRYVHTSGTRMLGMHCKTNERLGIWHEKPEESQFRKFRTNKKVRTIQNIRGTRFFSVTRESLNFLESQETL